jgi:phosphonate metabolism-associated iron-containing alcohol dehydrogenase
MTSFSFHCPTRVELGVGHADKLARFVDGERVLLLTYPSAKTSGMLARVTSGLEPRRVRALSVGEMPDARVLESLCGDAWREPFDVVVGVGGGSVLDAAKAVALFAIDRAPELAGFAAARTLMRGEAPPERFGAVPIVAVPTTAGTGSEVTPWATVWDRDKEEKHSLQHPALFPKIAVCDPALTVTLPTRTTVSSAFDALSHALEALWSKFANPISSALATAAAKSIVDNMPRAVREPSNVDAREALMLAAVEAGLAFASTKTGAAHALSYAVTLRRGISHGLACALWLAPILDTLGEQGDALVPALSGVLGARPGDGIRELFAAVGTSASPLEHGVERDDYPALERTLKTNVRGKNSRVDTDALLLKVARALGADGAAP